MKKQKTLMAVMAGLLLTTLLMSGCQTILVTKTGDTGTGEMKTRQFDFSGFTHVDIDSDFSYEIKQSDTYNISIMANDNLFDEIKVTKKGQTVEVRMELPKFPWSLVNPHPRPKAVITMPHLYGLNSSGATNGAISHFSSTNDLDIVLSGASFVELLAISVGNASFQVSGASIVSGDAEAENIDLDASGAGSVQLKGSANSMEIEASEASRLNLAKLTVNDAYITLSGASICTINLNGRLDTNLTGASRLEYIGEPTFGRMDISRTSMLNKK